MLTLAAEGEDQQVGQARVGVQGPPCLLHKQSFLGTLLRGPGRGILGCWEENSSERSG